jgi:hypothetical protein
LSAYSEYKCGAIPYDEFKSAMRRECEDHDPYDRYTCLDCASHKDCEKQVCLEGYPQCDQGVEKFEDEYEVYEAFQDNEFLIANYGTEETEEILNQYDIVDIQADYREWQK